LAAGAGLRIHGELGQASHIAHIVRGKPHLYLSHAFCSGRTANNYAIFYQDDLNGGLSTEPPFPLCSSYLRLIPSSGRRNPPRRPSVRQIEESHSFKGKPMSIATSVKRAARKIEHALTGEEPQPDLLDTLKEEHELVQD